MPELNFRCSDCKNSHKGNFLQYTNSSSFGNCAICGCFQNLTAAQLAQKMGYGTDLQKQQYAVVQGLRSSNQHFKAEVPMDRILDRLVEGQNLGKLYNPQAFYVRYREFYIDWMCTLCGELDHQPETFHHAVNTLDAYLQRSDIIHHIRAIPHFCG